MATEENSEQKFELDLSDDSLKAVQVTETTPAALDIRNSSKKANCICGKRIWHDKH